MIASWIAISNHCVFGAIAPTPDRTQNECPFHSKPAKPKMPAAGVQCCKILRATTTTPAKIPARAVVDLVESLGGKVEGLVFVVELEFLPGRKKLEGYDVRSLIKYQS